MRQQNLFEPHSCGTSERSRTLCERQGDELWTQYHQNFRFAVGCDPELNAPRGLCLFLDEPTANNWKVFWSDNCSQWMIVFRRQLALACQCDVVSSPDQVDSWAVYAFLILQNLGTQPEFPKPPVPVIMYGHDWHTYDYQRGFDLLKPEHFFTPCPHQWCETWRIPPDTKIWFDPNGTSRFFARPNLGEKKLDLLVVGVTEPESHYAARRRLTEQHRPLVSRYRIEFSHRVGWVADFHDGPVESGDPSNPTRYLNRWSQYLGSARYAAFGPDQNRTLVMKYYELLGSGAIPFLPECPDLARLGIEPGVHYIPLSEIEGDNERAVHYLDNYVHHHHIAVNAVAWHRENADSMLFDGFEKLIMEATGNRYPRRLRS